MSVITFRCGLSGLILTLGGMEIGIGIGTEIGIGMETGVGAGTETGVGMGMGIETGVGLIGAPGPPPQSENTCIVDPVTLRLFNDFASMSLFCNIVSFLRARFSSRTTTLKLLSFMLLLLLVFFCVISLLIRSDATSTKRAPLVFVGVVNF